jgi:hypothetical protein
MLYPPYSPHYTHHLRGYSVDTFVEEVQLSFKLAIASFFDGVHADEVVLLNIR